MGLSRCFLTEKTSLNLANYESLDQSCNISKTYFSSFRFSVHPSPPPGLAGWSEGVNDSGKAPPPPMAGLLSLPPSLSKVARPIFPRRQCRLSARCQPRSYAAAGASSPARVHHPLPVIHRPRPSL